MDKNSQKGFQPKKDDHDRIVYLGQSATRSITLTSDYVKAHAEMTGDQNPLYFDEEFTFKTKFAKLIVQGGLTIAYRSDHLARPGHSARELPRMF